MSTQQQQLQESRLHILGYFANNAIETQSLDNQHHSQQIQQKILALLRQKKQQANFVPLTLAAESNSIALIDNQHRAWLVTNRWKDPICLSDLLRLKIYRITLGYNQLVACTRQGCILLLWGNKKPIEESEVTKYTIHGLRNKAFQMFEAYLINNTSVKDHFLFPNLKKIADAEALFAIKSNDTHIISFPKLQKITFSHKVIGLSVGKYHKLCWDTEGKLFSWGCKSLALGHQFLPSELEVTDPCPVYHLKVFVVKAFAGVNYSLAVTREGKLYEWGVKKTNPAGEELIFEPRLIQMPKGEKVIDLKGKGQKYGALSISGRLYIWGKNVSSYWTAEELEARDLQDNYSNPTHLKQITDCVIDFSLEDSFLALVTANKRYTSISETQQRYWLNTKSAIRNNLRIKTPRLVTECGDEKQNSPVTNRTSLSFRQCVDPIEIAFNRRESKIKYFKQAENSDKVINYIMQQPKLVEMSFDRVTTQRSCKQDTQISVPQPDKSDDENLRRLFYECEKRKEYAQFLVKGVYALQAKSKNYKISRNSENRGRQPTQPKLQKPYSFRLQQALKKKEELNNQFFQKTINKLQSESTECRMRRRFEVEQLKKKKKEVDMCGATLQKQLIKAFILKLLLKPIGEARDVKIANFASHLKLQRLENNLRGLFIKNRIKFKMRKMFQNQIFRYSLMTVVFRKYVKKFRERKFRSKVGFVTQSIIKNVIKEKIKVGISTCTFNARKLQKFREWTAMVKAERKKCLKYMWKVYTLSMMKINSDHQSSAIFYLPKNVDDLMFESLYQQKVVANPLLKLTNFLDKYSIFRIKANYFQKLVTLFTYENKNSKESRQSKLMNTFSKSRKNRIKFHEIDDGNDRLNLMQVDIMPYSTHYNLLVHPKNYDISIPEIMKQHEKWVRQEKKVLEKHIEIILHENAVVYTRQRRAYDYELAKYILNNYEAICERRWKYIIQYNQTKQTYYKLKKEKELRRLMRLIGAEARLDEDCLPQKHVILEEALKRPDAPPAPSSNIVFRMSDFKRHFKPYYESLFLKAKELRRTCF